MNASGAISIAFGEELIGTHWVHHVEERIVERTNVGIDLLGERSGQKAEVLPRLYHRTREQDAPDLLAIERSDRHGHGKIGLTRTSGTHTESDGLRADIVEILLLHRSLRADHASFIGKDHIIMKLFRGVLPFMKERERALDRFDIGLNALIDIGEHVRDERGDAVHLDGRTLDLDLTAPHRNARLERILDETQVLVVRSEQIAEQQRVIQIDGLCYFFLHAFIIQDESSAVKESSQRVPCGISRGASTYEIGFAHASARRLDEHGFARSDAAQTVFFAQVASKREELFEALFFCGRIDHDAHRAAAGVPSRIE